jgi:hypothetical protein
MVAARIHGDVIEIKDLDDLSRVVEEAREDGEPLILIGESEEEFVVYPSERSENLRSKVDQVDTAKRAFLSSFGGWKDLIDRDQFMHQLREGRSARDRLAGIFEIDVDRSE